MPITEQEKLGVHARPLSDSLAGVPFKKRKLFFTRSPSPPPQLPPSLPEDCDVQRKPESSESDSPLSQTCNHPVIVNANDVNKSAVTCKEVHSESEEEVINRGRNVSQKLDTHLLPSDPGSGQYAADSMDVTNTEQEMVLDNKMLPLMGSMQLLPVIQETLEVPRKVGSEDGQTVQGEGISFLNNKILPGTGSLISEGPPSMMQETLEVPQNVESDEGKIVLSDEISGKQDNMEHKAVLTEPSDAQFKVDSGHHSLSRSNWDLNTMMDSWEGSKTKCTLNHETSTNGRLELVDMQEKRLDLCLDQILHKEASKADVMLGNCNVQTDDQDHKLLNQSKVKVEHSNFDACLDLQLKPSFLSNTCTTSSNLNSHGEIPSLSLSVSPTNMVYSEDLQLATNKVVKNEPYESGHGDTRIVDEMGGPNSLVLKPVKSEPCEGHETSKTTTFSDLKSACSIAVKPEPLNQSDGVKSSEGRLISSELEGHDLSLQSTEIDQRTCKFDGNLPDSTCNSSELKSLESFQKELGGHGLQSTEMHQEARKFEGNKSVITCKSPGLDERRLHSTAEDPSAHRSEISNNIFDQSQDAGIQHPTPCIDLAPNTVMHDAAKESVTMPLGTGMRLMISDANDLAPSLDKRMLHGDAEDPSAHTSKFSDNIVDNAHDADIHPPTPSNDLAPDTVMPNAAKQTVMTTMISGVNELNSKNEKCKTDNLPPLSESLAFDCKEHMTVGGLPEFVARVDSFDAYNSESACIDELTGQYEGSKVVESDEVKDKVDMSPVTLGKLCEIESKADTSYEAHGAINALSRQCGADDEDYEDGEVVGLALISAVEEPCKEKEEEQAKDIDSVNSVDVPVLKSSFVEEKEISIHNPLEVKDHGTVEHESSPCDYKNGHGSPSVGGLTANPAKTRQIRIVPKISKDHIKKNKDVEKRIKSDVGLSTNTVIKGHKDDVSNRNEKAEGSLLKPGKISKLCEKEPSQTDGAPKDASGTGQPRRIIYLNSSNRLASEKLKFESGGLSSSQIERESHLDCSFSCDRSQSRGSRNEPSSEKSRKIEVDWSQPHQAGAGKHVTDFMRNKSRTDEPLIAFHDDKNADSRHVLEHNNSSTGIRFLRRLNDSGMSGTATSIGPTLKRTKQENDELRNLSRMPPFRGLSPGARGQVIMGCHPIREISPGRFIGGERADFGLAHEENLMRNLPDSQPHAESFLVRRGRTSLSPTRQRSDALRLPVDCSESSSRARRRSPPQWTASRRCPNAYTGPPELVRCRSPQMIRLDRMRSPRRHPYYQEEMVVQRRAPPYVGRLSDDVIDMGPPARGHNFRRSMRGSNQDMRMFNVIDHREVAEEEYFRPPLHHGQIREFSEDDDYVDDRRMCEERRGPIRSFRQRFVPDDGDDDDSFRFRAEDGPSRQFRLCPENNNEGFPTRGSPRGFNGRLRNRLGNASGRFVGIEQEQEQDENYRLRHQEAQGWRDDGYTDIRMKRRRF